MPADHDHAPPDEDFLALADRRPPSLGRELVEFLRETRKWWLTPIVLALLVIGVLVILANTAAAPFLYTLF